MPNPTHLTDAPAALVGIDRADEQHAVCLRQTGRSRCEASTLKQTPEAIDEWASGKSCFVQRGWACPEFIRQTFHEFAQHSMGSSQWTKAHYQLQTRRGNKHHAAIRALAFKCLRNVPPP